MKCSRYVVFHEEGGAIYIYHQLTNALIQIDQELCKSLMEGAFESIPADIVEFLTDRCILIEDDIEESDLITYSNYKCRYASRYLRVTIMPTLNCNFRCWYCYERHRNPVVSPEDLRTILRFIKTRVGETKKDAIVLDWFGGEPMLCFNEVIVPFTKELGLWCDEQGIELKVIMTTNGSLIKREHTEDFNAIGLKQFQITLDGGRECHNRIRYSRDLRDSYSAIVDAIGYICKYVDGSSVELRVNYNSNNIASLPEILDSFDESCRSQIYVSPHIVWQNSDELERLRPYISDFCSLAKLKGYRTSSPGIRRRCVTCYTENVDQYVINYDLSVYKCTARDFDSAHCIGKIRRTDGHFLPSGLYYKFCLEQSPFINHRCLQCHVLPSCLQVTSCIQKKLEGFSPVCMKEHIEEEIHQYIHSELS